MNTTLNKIAFALTSLSGDIAMVAGGLVLQAEESRDDEE